MTNKRILRLSLLLIVLFISAALVKVADLVLVHRYGTERLAHDIVFPYSSGRAILLKELQPNFSGDVSPDNRYMAGTDGLVQQNYRVETDDDGFIKPSKIHDHPDVQIFFLGGSTTESLYVDSDHRFPYLVGRLLEAKTNRKVNTFNGGASGSNTLHLINVMLNKVVPYQPNYIVLMENINDLTTLGYYDSYWHKGSPRSPLLDTTASYPPMTVLMKQKARAAFPGIYTALKSMSDKARSAGGATDEHAAVRGKHVKLDHALVKAKYRKNLTAFVNLARAYALEPVLMTQFNRVENADKFVLQQIEKESPVDKDEFVEIYKQLNQEAREVAKRMDVRLIDLAREIPSSNAYMYDAVHLNERGSQLAAEKISEQFARFMTRPQPAK